MKDVETLIKQAQLSRKSPATRNQDMHKMHDYRGFVIEPIPAAGFTTGYNIVMYGLKHTLYVGGPGGWRLTENSLLARAFRDPKTCYSLIDEVIADWQGWIDSYGDKKVVQQQQPSNMSAEKIAQQPQMGVIM